MPKICTVEGCTNFRWSHGFCQFHGYMRTDDEFLRSQVAKVEKVAKKKKAKKDKPKPELPPVKPKRRRIDPLSSERGKRLNELHKLDREFYETIWSDRIHVCHYCGKWLGEELNIMYCHHPLLKSKYPELRHNFDNLDLTCFYCHNEAHSANPGEKHLQRKIDLIHYFKEKGLI